MGYVLSEDGFAKAISDLRETYRIFAPVRKVGQDVLRTSMRLSMMRSKRRRRSSFMRSCDMHAIKRQDDIYLRNGQEEDYFFRRRRELVKFVLILRTGRRS